MAGNIKKGYLEKWCGYSSVVHLTSTWQPRWVEVRPGILYVYENEEPKSSIPLNSDTKIKPNPETHQFTFEFHRKTIILKADVFEYAEWSEAIHKAKMTLDEEMQKLAALSYVEKLNVNNDSESEQETKPLRLLGQLQDAYDRDFKKSSARLRLLFESMIARTTNETNKKMPKNSLLGDYYRCIKQGLQYLIDDKTTYLSYSKCVKNQIRIAYVQHESTAHAVKSLNKDLYLSNLIKEHLEVFVEECQCEHMQDRRARALVLIQDKRSDSDEFFDAESSMDDVEVGMPAAIPEDRIEELVQSPKPQSINSVIIRRRTLPRPRTEFKVSLWSLLKDTIGRDLSRIALPVTFNEPTSFLQRSAEDFMYTELINNAATLEGPLKSISVSDEIRTAGYLGAFMISPFASASGRTFKPFNPLLGETYEISHRGFKYISEQVSHHPPALGYYCEDDAKRWSAAGDLSVSTNFSGKSLSVSMRGAYTITIGGHVWNGTRPLMTLDNVIFGKLNVDLLGQSLIYCDEIGVYVVIEYLRSSWWRSDDSSVKAVVYKRDGMPLLYLYGDWKSRLTAAKVVGVCRRVQPITPNVLNEAKKGQYVAIDWDMFNGQIGSPVVVWRAEARPFNSSLYYEFSSMSFELNEITPEYDQKSGRIPPTDSRFRPDQRLLEHGYPSESNVEKRRLEEKQRAAARGRVNGEADWHPIWFDKKPGVDQYTKVSVYPYKNTYFSYKEEVIRGEKSFADICPDIF